MRLKLVVVGFALATACWISPGIVSAAEANLPGKTSAPTDLVRAALNSELSGPSDLRKTLLEEAIKLDPNFAPARWQLGFVRRDGEWLTIDQLAETANRDGTLTAYYKLRDQLVSTAENRIALAKWCRKNKMPDQERIHWAKVLEFEPTNSEALGALGLQRYDGYLLTRQQIEQRKKQAGERLLATQHWRPRILKWRAAIESEAAKPREVALTQLRAISQPEAILALESVLTANGDSKRGVEANLLLIEVVSRITHPAATEALVKQAISSKVPEIQSAAISELKKRPPFAYVPLLLSGIVTDVRTRYQVYLVTSGIFCNSPKSAIGHFEFAQEGLFGIQHVVDDHEASGYGIGTYLNIRGEVGRIVPAAQRRVAALQESAEQALEWAKVTNARIGLILNRNMGFEITDDPVDLLNQWTEFSESYMPPLVPKTMRDQTYASEEHILIPAMSCFPAGTPISTLAGIQPIESIKIGDRVLAQNARTGELDYQLVQDVTLRPASKLINFTVGSETLRATRGHPFWVNGKGWVMAKQLIAGDVLHTFNGAVRIESIEEAPPSEAYNLVVTGFNTYFVGKQQILVHDNLPLEETSALVPGLFAESDLQAAK